MMARVGSSLRGRGRAVATLLVVLALAACGVAATSPPSNDRAWEPSVSRLATAQWTSPTTFRMNELRDWDYGPAGAVRRNWVTRSYDIRAVRGIWFFYTPFDFSDALGHTFITFEMERAGRPEFLTVSIEARKEVGEVYSPLRGIFGAYELAFVWSTEKDLLTKIAVYLERGARMYKVNIAPDKAGLILKGFIDRTNRLAANPELYNTLRNNCASELADVVNRTFGRRIPYDSSFILTGRAAAYLHSLGYLGDPDRPFRDIEARAEVGDLIKAYREVPERRFSLTLRRALAARQ